MTIRAVIFDRDNTLVYFDPHAIAQHRMRIGEVAPQLAFDEVLVLWQRWPGPWPQFPKDESAFWYAFWTTLARNHNLDAAQTRALIAISGFYHECFTAYPDTIPCLSALRALGYQLAILTNFELPSVDRTLTHAGIDPAFFTVIQSSAALGGIRKPDPRAFHAVTQALGEPPSACAFVDDLLVNIHGAQALDMLAFQLDRSPTNHNLDPQALSSLEPLPHILTGKNLLQAAGL